MIPSASEVGQDAWAADVDSVGGGVGITVFHGPDSLPHTRLCQDFQQGAFACVSLPEGLCQFKGPFGEAESHGPLSPLKKYGARLLKGRVVGVISNAFDN